MTTQTGHAIKKGRKFDQVLEGARAVFMRDGFERANVDDIARVAGVSKATLYSYFSDKSLLFCEVVQAECDRQSTAAMAEIDMTAPVEIALADITDRITRYFLSDFGQQIYRIGIAESHRFPELGKRFYASGPMMMRARLRPVLERYVESGELVIDDYDMASNQLGDLCRSDLFIRRLCGVIGPPPESDIACVAQAAVATFLARYGAP